MTYPEMFMEDTMDDLFGEDEDIKMDGLPYSTVFPVIADTPYAAAENPHKTRKLDELRTSSAHRQISWSARGCIATVTPDGKGLATYYLRRSSAGRQLRISPGLEVPTVRQTHGGLDITYLSWSPSGFELLVADTQGRVTILRFPFPIDSTEPDLQRSALLDFGSDLDVILASFWLSKPGKIPVRPQGLHRSNGESHEDVEHRNIQGPYQVSACPTVLCITRIGDARLDFRVGNTWKRRSTRLLPLSSLNTDLLLHASVCSGGASISPTDQTLLVATYTMVTGVQIWRLNMQWIPSARDLDVGLKAELLRSLPFSFFPLCIQLLPSCPGGDVSQKSETEAPENAPALLILHSWIKPAHPDLPPSSERPWGIRGWRLAAQSSPLHPVFDAIPASKKLAAGRNQRCYDWIEFTEFPLELSSEQPLHLLVEVLQLGCNRVGRAVDLSLPLVAYLRSQLKPLERLRSHKLSRQWSEEAEYACISPNQCLAAEAFSDGSVRISEFQWEYPTTRPLGDEDLTWTVEHFIPSAWAPWNSEDAALVASINRDRGRSLQFEYEVYRALDFETSLRGPEDPQSRERFHTEFLAPVREGTIDKSSRLRRFLAWQLQNSDSKLLATQARINLLLNTHCLVLLRSVQGFKAETNPQLLLSLVPLIRFYGKLAALILLYLRELCRGLTSLPEPYSVEQLNDLQSKLGMPALSLILHPISLYHMLHLYIRLLRLPDELQKLKALRPATHAPMLRARDQAADVLLGTLQQMPVPVNTFRIFLMGCIRALTPAPGPAPATGAPQAADPDLKLAEERLMVEARLSELHLPGALKILQDVVPGLFLTADQPPAGAAGAGAGAAGSFKVSMAALRYTDLSELEFVERAAAVGSAAPPPAKRVSAVTRGVIGGGAQVFRGLRLAVWRCVRCGAEQEDVPLAQRAAWQVHGLQNCVCGGAWEDVRKGRLVDRDYVR